jgi:phosphatidylserine/phosphatidylglycerophosphate/cardiolipin synthase-like enzyme
VNAINAAQKSIYVQAYSFTSTPIMRALNAAHERGVDVKVILDKSQVRARKYTSAKYFKNHDIPVWIDYEPEIAHNKVMIIDESEVITGSFNFTNAAQFRNAENVLIVKNKELAKKYMDNWKDRWTHSTALAGYRHTQADTGRKHEQQTLLRAASRMLRNSSL